MFIDYLYAPFSGEFGNFYDNHKYLTKSEPMQRNDFFRVFGEKKIKEMGRSRECDRRFRSAAEPQPKNQTSFATRSQRIEPLITRMARIGATTHGNSQGGSGGGGVGFQRATRSQQLS